MTGWQPLPALLRCRCNPLCPYTSNDAACSLHAEAGGSRRGGNGVADEAAQLRLRLQHRAQVRKDALPRLPSIITATALSSLCIRYAQSQLHRLQEPAAAPQMRRHHETAVVHLQAVGQEPGT